jgi:lysophospholipase L1-like esterase
VITNFANFTDPTGLTLNGTALSTGGVLRLTSDQRTQAGTVFANDRLVLSASTSWQTQFSFRLDGSMGTRGADGITFILQNTPAGSKALGGFGGGLGYGDLTNSLAIKFDTYKNATDFSDNYVAVLTGGSVTQDRAFAASPIDLNNGSVVNAWIDYDGTTDRLSVYLSNQAIKPTNPLLSYTVDLVSVVGNQAFVGFGAGTGDDTNNQDLLNWQFSSSESDVIAPRAVIAPTPAPGSGSSRYTFTVTYGDDRAVNVASLDSQDILVTGPGNFSQLATFVSVDNATNGSSRTATYRFTAPGGTWNAADNGTYTFTVQPNQILDTAGNAIPTQSLGTLTVALVDGNLVPKIMPLGDSITLGISEGVNVTPEPLRSQVAGGYRTVLWQNFQTDGLTVDFVGSKSNGPANLGDQDNDGYGGQKIQQISDNVISYLTTAQPDIVTLMIGTNNTFATSITNPSTYTFQPLAEMLSQLSELIDKILNFSPTIKLFVATIPPILPNADENLDATGQALQAQLVVDYNNGLVTLVGQKQAAGANIELVDMRSSLTIADIVPTGSSGVHPTQDGYKKIGDLWYAALRPVLGTQPNPYNVFVYQSPNTADDSIATFTSVDRFRIAATGFGGGLTDGVSLSLTTAATGMLVNGAAPTSAVATFLYENGVLKFDVDGTGSAVEVTIATITNAPTTLTVDQFEIVA